MIRVTTHVYPRWTLWSPSHYHRPSCILYLPLLASRSLDPVLVLLLVCFLLSVFLIHAWRSGSKIPFWHSFGLPLVPLDFISRLLLSFALSSYPRLQIVMVERPTQLAGLPFCSFTTATGGIETCAHGAAALELSSSLHCVVSSIVSCIRLYPLLSAGPNCSTWVTSFVDGSIDLSLMIVFITVTSQNWSRAVYLNHHPLQQSSVNSCAALPLRWTATLSEHQTWLLRHTAFQPNAFPKPQHSASVVDHIVATHSTASSERSEDE